MKLKNSTVIGHIWVICILFALEQALASEVPGGMVCLADIVPEIRQDIRYAGLYNFTDSPVPGYQTPACLLTRKAAEALEKVQHALASDGLGLKVYDCYRPQRAVDAFMQWAQSGHDATRLAYYPRLTKRQLLEDVYIARQSGHTRGSTVDVTLVRLVADQKTPANVTACSRDPESRNDGSLDMGTGFDCFDVRSNTEHPAVTGVARLNRLKLRAVMHEYGFRNYQREWWHYTLVDEPYPDRYFRFPITRDLCQSR